VWLCALVVSRLNRSPFGVATRATREVPVAVEAAGISTTGLTLFCFAVGAAIASIGGGLFATVNRSVGPETFTLTIVFLAIFMPLLGGQGSAWGAVAGAVLVVIFTFRLTIFRGTGTLVFALAVLIVLIAAPKGILGYIAEGGRRLASLWVRR
jgi:branched-chain amino acid transport system permease protein